MRFLLREIAGHSKIFAAPFRFIIGRRIGRVVCFGSVEELKIGSITRRSVAGGGGAHRMRILSKRHPKRCIKEKSASEVS
jgi:hypothetical protein